jgi:hypothetical protein
MGFTRTMRYAKYPGGKKYDDDGNENEQETWADDDKRAAAVVFHEKYQTAKDDPEYERERHQNEVYDAEPSPM